MLWSSPDVAKMSPSVGCTASPHSCPQKWPSCPPTSLGHFNNISWFMVAHSYTLFAERLAANTTERCCCAERGAMLLYISCPWTDFSASIKLIVSSVVAPVTFSDGPRVRVQNILQKPKGRWLFQASTFCQVSIRQRPSFVVTPVTASWIRSPGLSRIPQIQPSLPRS